MRRCKDCDSDLIHEEAAECGGSDDQCAIQPKDEHKDDGSGGRLCMSCWERLWAEAGGAGKDVA